MQNDFLNTALILVDIQQGFDDIAYWGGERNNYEAESKAARLLSVWREKGLPVFHIQHCSSNPKSILHESSPGNAHKEIVKPLLTEPVIKKNVNSSFIGTDLEQRLRKNNIKRVVICGLTTDHCVSTTTRMAGNLGFDTFLVSDATATFGKRGINNEYYSAETIHLVALAHLKDEFATILTTDQLLKLLND